MKKFLSVVLLAVAMFAAIPAKAGVNFGLKGGYNITSFRLSSDVVDDSNKSGFFIGPTVKLSLPVLPVGFDLGVFYDQRDSKVDGNTISQRSVNIPLNVRYELGLGDLAGIYVAAGPQFGFNVGNGTKIFNSSTYKFKDSNFSVNVGAGVRLINHLEIGFTYNIAVGKTGEISTVTDALSGAVENRNARSNAWQISAAYYF